MTFSALQNLVIASALGFILPLSTSAQPVPNSTGAPWVFPYDGGPVASAEDRQRAEMLLESSELRLMRYLVGDYDNSVRPVFDANDPVDIRLGLTLTQILDLDEKNQVLTTNVWLEAEWFDQRLNWSALDFGGVTSIRIPCHKLWLPDIVLYNSVDDYTSGYMPSLAMVYNSSRVFWGPVIRFRSSCQIDITFFPFDTQVCKLKMGSWAYTGLQVNVWNSSHTMDLSNLVDNGEWELLGVAVKRNVVFYNCCEEPFPDVTFSIQLRRRTKYYFMNIIIPCIILSFLCLGGFLLPPESGEKITLGLSVLLTITVFMLMVADKMPQTSESISVISIYLMVVLATSCLSVLSSVLVLSIHHQRGRPSRAPLWLRRLCFSLVARLLRLVQIRDAYATEFGNTKTSPQKKKTRFENSADGTPCCYSNCRSPEGIGSRLETHYATGRCKIASNSPGGYIEMRTQIRHDFAGRESNEDAKLGSSEYQVAFSQNHCRNQQNIPKHCAEECKCYTSRVYDPPHQDVNCKQNPNHGGRGHRTPTYSAYPCGEQERSNCLLPHAEHYSSNDSQNKRRVSLPCKTESLHDRDSVPFACRPDSKENRWHPSGYHHTECGAQSERRNASDVEKCEYIYKGNSYEINDDESLCNSASDSDDNHSACHGIPAPTHTAQSFYVNAQNVLVQEDPQHEDSVDQKQDTALPNSTLATNRLQQPAHNATYRTILRYLLSLVQIRQEQEVSEVQDEELYKEWHDVAFVLDRLLFYLFFFVTLVSTIGILEMRPETEPL